MRPPIGFDRDIKLEWLDMVGAQVAAGHDIDHIRANIHKMLSGVLSSGKSGSALTKTTTVLLRIWSRVPEPAVGLRDRISAIFLELDATERLAAHWAMSIASYPFFLDVANHIGRLLVLQGEVSRMTLRRRLAERWGDRSLMPQAAGKVVRSMVAWGALRDIKLGLYGAPIRPVRATGAIASALIEAILVGSGQRSMPISNIDRHPALFPFAIVANVGTLRAAKQFSIHRQGVDAEIVELASR